MIPAQKPLGRRAAAGFALLVPLDAIAQVAAQAAPQIPVSPISLGNILQVLFGLGLVLAAVGGIAWLLKRLSPGQVGMGGVVKVVGGVAVGPKERLVLVEVGETWLVVGVAPGRVSAVHTMPRPEGATGSGTPALAEGVFAAWLRQATQRRHPG